MKLVLEFKQNSSSSTSINRIKPTFENILNVIKEEAVNEIGIEEIFSLEWEDGELVFEPSNKIKKVKIIIER